MSTPTSTRKKNIWILNCQTQVNSFNFKKKIQNSLYDYIEHLAAKEKFFSHVAFDKQLRLLLPLSDEHKLEVIEGTIEHDWLNLKYKIEQLKGNEVTASRAGKSKPKDLLWLTGLMDDEKF